MKVIEANTDRHAEVHLYIDGSVTALEEYGQYVNPGSKAICCYVPIDLRNKVRIAGKFSGTVSLF